MVHFIDKDALVAEIKRRFDEYSSSILRHYDACKEAKAQELGKILTIIDTLEVKEVDLEREMQAFAALYLEPLKISDSNIGISITMSQLYSCAKHFFELGMAVSNKAQKGE